MRAGIPRRLAVIVVLLAAGLAECGPKQGAITGRAVAAGAAVPGATAEAYLSGERGEAAAPFVTAAADADGAFRLEVPPGRYWVWVKDLGTATGPRRIAEHSGNPVTVAAGSRADLGEIELHAVGDAPDISLRGAGVRGRALFAEEPVPDAAVMIYAADRTRLAGPGYLALVRTGEDGRFQADIAPGSYRIALRKRQGSEVAGFLRAGDLSAVPAEDPVVVSSDTYRDLGDIRMHEVDPTRLGQEAARGFQGDSATAIEGQVVDKTGKPWPGIFVFVYRDEGMIGRPDAVAAAGAKGEFALALPGGGRYYLGARGSYGGPRRPGEVVGKLAGAERSAIEVPAGRRVKGLVIVAEEMW